MIRFGVIGAGRILGQFVSEGRFRVLRQNHTNGWGKGWVWHGQKTDVSDGVYTDLEQRISERAARKSATT